MIRTDYNAQYIRIIEELQGKPRLLLHVCCAPCMSAAIESLCAHFDVTVYFYNPNIFPESEYEKRYGEVVRLLSEVCPNAHVIKEKYNRADYDNAVGNFKGGQEGDSKCEKCCYDRLKRTAEKAAVDKFDYFTTTLTSSPMKNAEMLNRMMSELSQLCKVPYLPSDFKKKGGNIKIKNLCEKYEIYRQKYCGCTPPRIIAAVTGGIAAGKSTLMGIFKRLGAYTLDADKITRELQAEGTEINIAIKSAFPSAVKDGTLDRVALKNEVFSNQDKLSILESIVHPAVKAEIEHRISLLDANIIVVEVPLLFESGMQSFADVTVNVEVSPETRRARAMERDGMTAETFDSVAKAQLSDDERRLLADVTVCGDNLNTLERSAEELMQQWQDRLK